MSDSSSPEPPNPTPTRQPTFSNRYVLLFGVVMLIGLLFLAWLGRPPRSVAIGQPLPRIDLQPLTNATETISNEDLLGKYALLHFWGTWCPPCIEEFPAFAQLVEETQGDENLMVVSVSCSPGPEYDLDELQEKTDHFLNEYAFPMPTYCDPAAMTRQQLALILPNGSFGYPTTFLVDPSGTIIDALEGYYPGDMEKLGRELEKQLESFN